ncbi:V-type ATP synthase subunit I [Haloimpatiens myeolchijeotgali]|uniref:V-type ATP synthase subunit I n=1 Tax=Haloimpatiens sp. FM7330 TaxID=3298610 RepID=UPI00384BF1E2
MNKFTLFALESQKEALLENLQKFEGVHFSNLQDEVCDEELSFLNPDKEDEKLSDFTEKLSQINFGINFLEKFIEPEKGFKSLFEGKKQLSYNELKVKVRNSNWYETYKILKGKDDKINELKNEITNLESEIENLVPWSNLDASFGDLNNLKFCSSFLGIIPEQFKDNLINELSYIDSYYIEEISRDRNEVNILVIAYKSDIDKVDEILKKNNFSQINFKYQKTPREIISNLRKKMKEFEKEKEKVTSEVTNFTKEIINLKCAYEYFNNELIKARACENFVKTEKVFAIEGWIPLQKNSELEKIVKHNCAENYYIEFCEACEEENVPILLKNNGFTEAFESITEMYSLPSYKEIDPTPILAVFYFIFFGMMLSDGGYGLIMVIGSALALKLLPLEKAQKNFAKLFLFLGISTMFWGALYGGWFGDAPKALLGIQVPKLIDPGTGLMKIMVVSIVFGLVHMFIGLGIKAYVLIKNNKYKDAFCDVVFWYCVLIGGILMAVQVGGSLGKILLVIGILGLFLTQGREAPTIGGKIGGGVYGVYGITGYFGDIVSYSRLMALGLATGFIASALNMIINLIPAPVSYIVGPILFILLHAFNLAINALGSYVHAARLQYLEFFNKFYEGGGKKFTPFKTISKFVKITDK